MPIEVRELIIKAEVVQEGETGTSSAQTGDNNVSEKEELIKSCVERVLEIINDNYER